MIPQVNALATKRNREQTREICSLLGKDCAYLESPPRVVRGSHHTEDYQHILLPNGSFTLCQVVGMLEAEDYRWVSDEPPYEELSGWTKAKPGQYDETIDAQQANPHDLTAAMDALIKVLETKGEKE